MTASPPSIMVAGTVQIVLVALALLLIWRRKPLPSETAAVVAFGSFVGFTYARLMPSWWPAYSDSYITGPRIGVT